MWKVEIIVFSRKEFEKELLNAWLDGFKSEDDDVTKFIAKRCKKTKFINLA